MFHLDSAGLRVSILDPVADRKHIGSRYCAGGYIWQVTDAAKGPLFSGPEFPNPDPRPFDGQGVPEVFEIALGAATAKVGEDVWVIGVGRVRRESPLKPFHVRNNFTIMELAPWKTVHAGAMLTMTSRQNFKDWDFSLERRVVLKGRTLISTTVIKNQGKADVPIRWFAHPFFPHAGFECGKLSVECDFPSWVPVAGGFRFNAKGALERNPEHDWKSGCYQLLNLPFGAPMDIIQKHPALGEVKIECKFPVAWMPLWANENTVSFEPYYHTVLHPGSQTEWSIRYGF
ncbi:MAG: hypothetical protein M3Y08_18135 [Fibrobacterota bacterium]|nr:hypothetical protein [Fibrobacterota bacterium]